MQGQRPLLLLSYLNLVLSHDAHLEGPTQVKHSILQGMQSLSPGSKNPYRHGHLLIEGSKYLFVVELQFTHIEGVIHI